MVSDGDAAPTFTAPLANGDIEEFNLATAHEDGPVVLAFFPAAFSGVCTHEMNDLKAAYDDFVAAGFEVYGVSVDLPFTLNAFRDDLELPFDMVSDANREVIHEYDVQMAFESMGVDEVAKRAVFVVDTDGEVVHSWVTDDPGVEPDFDEILDAATPA